MSNQNHRSMAVEDAVRRYLEDRRPEVSDSTHYNHSSLLRQFTEWCDGPGNLEVVTALDGWDLMDFKSYRRDEDGINEVTLRNQFSVLRCFIRWCESMDLVDDGMAESMIMPTPDDLSRDTLIREPTATAVLDYLDKYEYATLRHTLFALIWTTGFRLGTCRALDVDDLNQSRRYTAVRHRPDHGTPLKNGADAEREVNLHGWVVDIIDDYIKMHRHDMEDEYGRRPLLTSAHGRVTDSPLRDHITGVTRPCHYDGTCPHDRDEAECEATARLYSQRCPSSISPHDLRRSAITHWLSEGHDTHLLSDRMDVSPSTLDEHYDQRTESEKREVRRDAFDLG